MTRVTRFLILSLLALASAFAGPPISIEVNRTHTAAGAFGCTVSGATVATPSVLTCTAAHNLITGDQVMVTGIGGTTTDNGLFYVNALTTTTLALYTDPAASASPVTGVGTYTSGGKVSQAWDISGWTGDYTAYIAISGASSGKSNVCLQDSADGFVNDIVTHVCMDVSTTVNAGTVVQNSWRSYQMPSLRVGVTNARIRVNLQSQDSGASVTVSAYLK